MTRHNSTGRIWLIGGTQESVQLARAIAPAHLPCTISVATASARSLYADVLGGADDAPLKLWVGKLSDQQLPQFLREQDIRAVLDASHPFAVEISKLAIAASAEAGILYLRYERLALEPGSQADGEMNSLLYLDDFAALLAGNHLAQQRVLLTVGYRPLARFQPWQARSTLFARILPSATALEAALAAGFTSDRLIALRPPISAEMERALWQQWQVSMVVTKASGTPGGEAVKRQVSAELGVKLVVIDRPQITYPQQTSNLSTALEFCKTSLIQQNES